MRLARGERMRILAHLRERERPDPRMVRIARVEMRGDRLDERMRRQLARRIARAQFGDRMQPRQNRTLRRAHATSSAAPAFITISRCPATTAAPGAQSIVSIVPLSVAVTATSIFIDSTIATT